MTERSPIPACLSHLTQRDTELLAALKQIARMKIFPDDKVNRFTLLAAIGIAEQAISKAEPSS